MSDATRFFAATDVGRVREHNEDNFLVDKKLQLFMVADGMGGHAAGEVASAICVRTIHEELKREKDLLSDYVVSARGANRVTPADITTLLEHAVHRACQRIHEEAQADAEKRGMGTTLSLLLVLGHHGFIAHVGDSRIYMLRAGKCQQITEDHTVMNELIRRGKLTQEQIAKVAQKNAITRAVGVYERVDVDTLMLELVPGDRFTLASDGLTGYLESAEELGTYVGLEGDEATKSLVHLANERGGKDNITVIVVHVGGESGNEERAKKVALKREIVAKMPMFSRLTERELLRVMQALVVRSFKAEDVVIREGDKGEELFIILDGRVRVLRGEEALTTLGQGQHFGEMALIRDVPRSATIISDGPSEILVMRRSDFFDILRQNHEAAVKILWQFLGALADRLDQTSGELRQAKEEMAAVEYEDVTVEIFPSLEAISAARPASKAPPHPPKTPPKK
jgi:serine/threonine protein phosphatase PrpC/CRP-like cAMP-binding protein